MSGLQTRMVMPCARNICPHLVVEMTETGKILFGKESLQNIFAEVFV